VSAPVWNRTSISCASGRRHHQIGFESKIVAGDHQGSMVSCPATGIVNYLIVKDHPRPSPELLPRFMKRLVHSAFGQISPVHGGRRRLPGRASSTPEMKKAAEVDFTRAACARTYE
jgi:hypothetical protein